jgi:hypothetical protein
MDTNNVKNGFANSSQRVAYTYQRMLSPFYPVNVEGLTGAQQVEMSAAQADLHAFFRVLYDALYTDPEQFGLPFAADSYLVVDHSKEGRDKTEVKRVLDRQRKLVDEGLNFLSAFGQQARVEGKSLVLDPGSGAMDFFKKKNGRAWAKGMERAGLIFTLTSGSLVGSNMKFPNMMPALKLLAESCVSCENQDMGRVFFARCDFRALQQDFSVTAPDLFHAFKPENADWAMNLHNFFIDRDYKALVEIGRMFAWSVKYQGKKSIKASPLFQVDYDERLLNQMRAGIKCASAQRLTPLLPNQTKALQDDFARRSNRCGDCHWCDNQKSLGPVEYEYEGERRKICWYVNSDLNEFSRETVDLVKEYALMHEGLGDK